MGCFDRFHLELESEIIAQNETDTTQMFPTDFLLESPTSAALYNESVVEADEATAEIARLLAADDITECATHLAIPNKAPDSTNCFGPTMQYTDYPVVGGDGQLPGRDLGIWLETEPGTNIACSAQVLNVSLGEIHAEMNFARQSLASKVCLLRNDATLNLPTDGSTLDMRESLDGIVGNNLVAIKAATISVITVDGYPQFTYSLTMGIKQNANADEDEIQIDMQHHLLNSSGSDYAGWQKMQRNQETDMGNCPGTNTIAGVLFFEKVGSELKFHLEKSEFCKMNDNPWVMLPGTLDETLDPSYTYDGIHIGGWGNSYNIFNGNFDRASKTGLFSYLWQAGPHDGYSRIFNVEIGKAAALAGMPAVTYGNAYYAYGMDLTDIVAAEGDLADPTLEGFICDWATPGNQKIVQPHVQYQAMHFDTDLNLFVSDGVNIGYAPTHDCTYDPLDEDDDTFFNYDINADHVLDGEDFDIISLGVANDLLPIDEMDFTAPEDLLTNWGN